MNSQVWKKYLCSWSIWTIFTAGHSALALSIDNPIKAQSFGELVQAVANAITSVGVIFAVVALIFGGFRFISAAASGNEKDLGEAKKTLGWIVLGSAIVVGASILAKIIVGFARDL